MLKHTSHAASVNDICYHCNQDALNYFRHNAPGWRPGTDTNIMVIFNMPICGKCKMLYHWTCCGSHPPTHMTARIYMPAGFYHNVMGGYKQKLGGVHKPHQDLNEFEKSDESLHQAMAHYLHRYAYEYLDTEDSVGEKKQLTAQAAMVDSEAFGKLLPMAMSQVVRNDTQTP